VGYSRSLKSLLVVSNPHFHWSFKIIIPFACRDGGTDPDASVVRHSPRNPGAASNGAPNHPEIDHFGIETHGDWGIPHFRKATYIHVGFFGPKKTSANIKNAVERLLLPPGQSWYSHSS
jgi:hypothetical protein